MSTATLEEVGVETEATRGVQGKLTCTDRFFRICDAAEHCKEDHDKNHHPNNDDCDYSKYKKPIHVWYFTAFIHDYQI